MRAREIMTGISPPSDSMSEKSPGKSPNRFTFSNGHPISPLDAASVSRHWMVDGHAPRACEKCRQSKRKCDKKLPQCDRCLRLNAKCHYLQDPMIANPSVSGAQIVIYEPQSLTDDVMVRNTDPLSSLTVSQILSLVSMTASPDGPELDWRSPIEAFFQYIYPWFAIVHPILFEKQIMEMVILQEAPSPAQSQATCGSAGGYELPLGSDKAVLAYSSTSEHKAKELALLVVSMHLIVRLRRTETGEQDMFDEAYRAVKRILALVFMMSVNSPSPSLEIVQCGALIALYEYGHGEVSTAYRTLVQTSATASILGIVPGMLDATDDEAMGDSPQDILPAMEKAQRGGVWWGLFILDQFIHKNDAAINLPFVVESPTGNITLPEMPPYSPPAKDHATDERLALIHESQRNYPTTVIVGTVPLNSFQLSAKISSLLHRALRINKKRDPKLDKMPSTATFQALDGEIRQTTYTLLEQTTHWETMLDCFSMCVSSLFTLYMPYLPFIRKCTAGDIQKDTELSTALAALRFACKMSTDISCQINQRVGPDSLAVLAAPASSTCYLVILAFADLRHIFPAEAEECYEAIAEKFETLKMFSGRWGIAETMMRQLEEAKGLIRSDYIPKSESPP